VTLNHTKPSTPRPTPKPSDKDRDHIPETEIETATETKTETETKILASRPAETEIVAQVEVATKDPITKYLTIYHKIIVSLS